MKAPSLDQLHCFLNRPTFRVKSVKQMMALRRYLSSDHSVFDLRKLVQPPPRMEETRARLAPVPRWDEFSIGTSGGGPPDLVDYGDLDEFREWLEWAGENWGAPTLLHKPSIVAESFAPPQVTYEFLTVLGPPFGALLGLVERFPTVDMTWDYWDPAAKSWEWIDYSEHVALDFSRAVTWESVLKHLRGRGDARRLH